jgi:Xaa-Pro aminopeptidase
VLEDPSPRLTFKSEEFSRRIASVRDGMAERALDVLAIHGAQAIFYLTGHYTFGALNYQCLVLPRRAEPVLIVRQLESGNARELSWLPGESIVAWQDDEDPIQYTAHRIRDLGLERGTVGLDENSFYTSARTARRLKLALPTASLVDASELLDRARRVKSAAEIDLIRHACELTALGMDAAFEAARPGVTENDVAAAAFTAMVRGGSEYLTVDPIVTSGSRSGVPHMTFHRRVLDVGDTMLLEMGAVFNRYVGPSMRSGVLGEPRPEVRRYADVCLEALAAALAAVRPGATAGDVEWACREPIERAGLGDAFRKRAGYSVGIGFAPGWVEGSVVSLDRGSQTVLAPGMVFHIPPALRKTREFGVGFSETVVVTETGCEELPSAGRQLRVC